MEEHQKQHHILTPRPFHHEDQSYRSTCLFSYSEIACLQLPQGAAGLLTL